MMKVKPKLICFFTSILAFFNAPNLSVLADDNGNQNIISLQPPSFTGKPNTIKIWVKSFIPNDLSITRKSPYGSSGASSTGINGPPLTFFMDDGRSFSDNYNASYRTRSVIVLNSNSYGYGVKTLGNFGKTIGWIPTWAKNNWRSCVINRHTVEEENSLKFQPISPIFHRDSKDNFAYRQEFTVNASASDPCIQFNPYAGIGISCNNEKQACGYPLAPSLDYKGKISVMVGKTETQSLGKYLVSIYAEMEFDDFPSFEVYASVNNGAAYKLLIVPPKKGATAFSLFGPYEEGTIKGGLFGTWRKRQGAVVFVQK